MSNMTFYKPPPFINDCYMEAREWVVHHLIVDQLFLRPISASSPHKLQSNRALQLQFLHSEQAGFLANISFCGYWIAQQKGSFTFSQDINLPKIMPILSYFGSKPLYVASGCQMFDWLTDAATLWWHSTAPPSHKRGTVRNYNQVSEISDY